jgi:hypothetical protein
MTKAGKQKSQAAAEHQHRSVCGGCTCLFSVSQVNTDQHETPQTGNRQPVFLGFSEVAHEKMLARPSWASAI